MTTCGHTGYASACDDCVAKRARFLEMAKHAEAAGYQGLLVGSPDAAFCDGCGGRYVYDTALPSAVWNRVIRAQGLPEYLCAACIILHFVRAKVSFTAELYGEPVRGDEVATIAVQVGTVPFGDTEGDRELQVAERLDAALRHVFECPEHTPPVGWVIGRLARAEEEANELREQLRVNREANQGALSTAMAMYEKLREDSKAAEAENARVLIETRLLAASAMNELRGILRCPEDVAPLSVWATQLMAEHDRIEDALADLNDEGHPTWRAINQHRAEVIGENLTLREENRKLAAVVAWMRARVVCATGAGNEPCTLNREPDTWCFACYLKEHA